MRTQPIGGYAGPGGSPTPTPTSTPTPCSRIAFDSTRDGNNEIYVMNADGTNQTRLTNNTANDARASFSPDGNKIAFGSNRDGNYEIYVMNADGTGQTRLTSDPADDYIPNFSPDGSKIVFESKRDGVNEEIYVMNADGTNQTRLTNSPARDGNPAFSPDGSKIIFESDRDGNLEIYVMNADGSGQTRLTNNSAQDGDPFFSADSSEIAFETDRDGGFFEIYVMNADGTEQINLTNNPAHDTDPFFSPDGSKIAFETTRDGVGNYEVYVMNADGTGQTNLTNSPAHDFSPSWTGCQGSPAPTCVPRPVGMVSWWPGDSNANDIQGNNNGTLQNGATFAPGMVSQAFSFDGADDVVTVPNVPSLSFGPNSPMTVELWAYRTGEASVMHFIGKRTGCGFNDFNYQMAFDPTRGLQFGGDPVNAPVITGQQMPLNIWTHLAGTFDGTTFRFYINGSLAGTSTGTLGPINDAPLEIGNSGTCAPFQGLIDEVSLYSRALSISEIQAIYNAGSAGKCKMAESDFSVNCNPSLLSLAQGSGGTTACTVTSLNGFSSDVALSCSGQPAGVTFDFSPNPVTPPANGSIISTLTVNVASNASPGSYTFQVVGTDGNLTQTFDLQLTVTSFSADLSVTKADSPDPVIRGNNITYTVIVTNNGPSSATNVSLSDAVPTNTNFVSNSGAPGWSCTNPPTKGAGTGTITCTTPGLTSGASATFTIVVEVKPGTRDGTIITNIATVSSSTSDPNPGNNSAMATTTATRR
jgi:uncharacterized repeat protein (TIGR01451 family)